MAVTDKERERIKAVFSGPCLKKKVCPVKDIMASYGDKWTMHCILLLGQQEKIRFSELRSSIDGISQRMLTVTLRSLEHDGIITRTVYPEVPPKVEYSLTNLGESLLRQIMQFAAWAEDHFSEIVKTREKFEKKSLAAE